jgi:hypothetical protein
VAYLMLSLAKSHPKQKYSDDTNQPFGRSATVELHIRSSGFSPGPTSHPQSRILIITTKGAYLTGYSVKM